MQQFRGMEPPFVHPGGKESSYRWLSSEPSRVEDQAVVARIIDVSPAADCARQRPLSAIVGAQRSPGCTSVDEVAGAVHLDPPVERRTDTRVDRGGMVSEDSESGRRQNHRRSAGRLTDELDPLREQRFPNPPLFQGSSHDEIGADTHRGAIQASHYARARARRR
jgi:hypothetical protein